MPGGVLQLEWDGAGEVVLDGPGRRSRSAARGPARCRSNHSVASVSVEASSLYDEISSRALSSRLGRREIESIERAHPELIARGRGGIRAVAIAPSAQLAYAFESDTAFIEEFPELLETLLSRMQKARIDTARFRLTHNPARPVVEPVLKRLWFSPSRSWLQFGLDRKDAPKVAALKGVKFRDGGPADIDAVLAVDRDAFPGTPLPRETLANRLEEGSRLLVATVSGKISGFAIYDLVQDGVGYLYVLAVAESYRGRGIGEALTARVAKAVFAERAHRLDLRTADSNATAIRLYVRMGFRQVAAGRDYTRPVDPRAITRIKKTKEGTVIRFGGWR